MMAMLDGTAAYSTQRMRVDIGTRSMAASINVSLGPDLPAAATPSALTAERTIRYATDQPIACVPDRKKRLDEQWIAKKGNEASKVAGRVQIVRIG